MWKKSEVKQRKGSIKEEVETTFEEE